MSTMSDVSDDGELKSAKGNSDVCDNGEPKANLKRKIQSDVSDDEEPKAKLKSDASEYVKLNVGESLFRTTRGTLTKYDTMLQAMFSGEIGVETDSEGWVLIDRCGKHFGAILNYLRDGEIALPESLQELQELLAEAEFYRIEGLIKCIQARVKDDAQPTNPSITVSSLVKAQIIIKSSSKHVWNKGNLYGSRCT